MENGIIIPEWLGIFITLAPLFLFLLTVFVIYRRLKGKINIADFLIENEVHTDKGTKAKTVETKKSASRLILFLSGITSLILGVCFTTYFFYINIYCITCNSNMDLGEFSNILLALGIGVVPYAVNQVKRI